MSAPRAEDFATSQGWVCPYCDGAVNSVTGQSYGTGPDDVVWSDYASCACGRSYFKVQTGTDR